jgi:hypothetical protein
VRDVEAGRKLHVIMRVSERSSVRTLRTGGAGEILWYQGGKGGEYRVYRDSFFVKYMSSSKIARELQQHKASKQAGKK